MVICFTTQKLINRNIKILSFNIPASNINGGHSTYFDGTASHTPEGMSMQVIPNFFCIHWIHANDQLGIILTLSKSSFCTVAICKTCFSKATDSLIGIDFYNNRIPFEYFDTGNFHCTAPFFFIDYPEYLSNN